MSKRKLHEQPDILPKRTSRSNTVEELRRTVLRLTGINGKQQLIQGLLARKYLNTADDYYEFNMPLDFVNVDDLTDFSEMFMGTVFNQDLSHWNVSNGTKFNFMFAKSMFNGNISNWKVDNGTDFTAMFYSNLNFLGDISNWNVSKGNIFRGMFAETLFDGDISRWDVSNGTDFKSMFNDSYFNGDISEWNVHNGENFSHMFEMSQRFNGDISRWDVSKGNDFSHMFFDAVAFRGDLTGWTIQPDAILTQFTNRGDIILPPINDDEGIVAHEGNANQVHAAFNNVNVGNLAQILNNQPLEYPVVTDVVQCLALIQNMFTAAVKDPNIVPETRRKQSSKLINYIYNRIDRRDEVFLTESFFATNCIILVKSVYFMLQQSIEIKSAYVQTYVDECAMAYLTLEQQRDENAGIPVRRTLDDAVIREGGTVTCEKGQFERIIICMKSVFITACIEHLNDERDDANPQKTCKNVFKEILEKVFRVNLTMGEELNYVDVEKKWHDEHLTDETYQKNNNVFAETTLPAVRIDFFKKDYIQYMTNVYNNAGMLTDEIVARIKANSELYTDVFKDMQFGGGRKKRKMRTKKNKKKPRSKRYFTLNKRNTYKKRKPTRK